MLQKLNLALTILLASMIAPPATAGTTLFAGSFALDNDLVRFRVVLPMPEVLTVYTTSAASGPSSAAIIARAPDCRSA